MTDGAFQLRGAGDVFATPRDEFRIASDGAFAYGTFAFEILVEFELLSLARSLFRRRLDDRWDDLPAFSMITVSPIWISLRLISSSLWSVAREIVEPARKTGSSSATGVSVPVRPT